MQVMLEVDDYHPLLAEQTKIAMNQLFGIIEWIITNGIEQGELKPDSQVKKIAIIWISSLEGALALSRLYQDMEYINTVSSQLFIELKKNHGKMSRNFYRKQETKRFLLEGRISLIIKNTMI